MKKVVHFFREQGLLVFFVVIVVSLFLVVSTDYFPFLLPYLQKFYDLTLGIVVESKLSILIPVVLAVLAIAYVNLEYYFKEKKVK